MKITEREMRGLLSGKCLPGDMRLNEDLPSYLVRKFDELQQKLDAMAAENAALMKFCKNSAFDADYESELGMERGGFTDAINDIKTPATDAYLNSVRAEAVSYVADHIDSLQRNMLVSSNSIRDYAVMFRSGNHDTADKAG